MSRLGIWNSGRKGNTYNYIDKMISQWMGASGTGVYVHLYLGVHDQSEGGTGPASNVTEIQDVLLLENRDRKYSENVYELRGVYNVTDIDFDMRQFGFFLTNDTLFIEFHMNDCISQLGRKLMAGDVLELPHQRDDALLDGGKAANKFYVIDDVNRASDGYSPTWYPHILRVKCAPMTAGEEFSDILEKPAKDHFGFNTDRLTDLLSTLGREMEINEEIVEEAKRSVKKRNFETQHLYVVPGEELTNQKPWVLAGDGIPPNGQPCGSGDNFPQSPTEGDYFLRTDYWPQTLFRRVAGSWRIQEYDFREDEWSVAHATLKKYINNRAEVTFDDGTTKAEKTGLYQAVKPRADL